MDRWAIPVTMETSMVPWATPVTMVTSMVPWATPVTTATSANLSNIGGLARGNRIAGVP